MLMHKRVAEQYLNQMRELLESRILPFFQQILSYGGCSRPVIRLLKDNIVKDLAKITNEVSPSVMVFILNLTILHYMHVLCISGIRKIKLDKADVSIYSSSFDVYSWHLLH